MSTAFEKFSGFALRALNAEHVSSPFGPNIITKAALRIGDMLNSLVDHLNRSIRVTCTVADVTGGETDGTLNVVATDINGSQLKAGVQFIVVAQADKYDPVLAPSSTVSFSTATAGSIVDQGAGWALVETDDLGAFACTIVNSADETVQISALPPIGGAEDTTKAVFGVVSNSDAATWSA